jgi:hypothetical protein
MSWEALSWVWEHSLRGMCESDPGHVCVTAPESVQLEAERDVALLECTSLAVGFLMMGRTGYSRQRNNFWHVKIDN